MVNLIITEKCNQNCPFCFFKERRGDSMSEENFGKILGWLIKNQVNRVGLLGGEPFLHEKIYDFLEILSKSKIETNVITNSTIPLLPEKLRLIKPTKFLINHSSARSKRDLDIMEANISLLKSCNFGVSAAVTIYKQDQDMSPFVRFVKENSIKNARIDIANPSFQRKNLYVPSESYKSYAGKILGLVDSLRNTGASVVFDCGISCGLDRFFSEDEQKYIEEQVSLGPRYCKPVLDVFPDLSVCFCFPLIDCRIDCILDHTYYGLLKEAFLKWGGHIDYKVLYQGSCLGHINR